MVKILKVFTLALVVASLSLFSFTGCQKSSQTNSGEKPIDFTLTDLDGNTVTLSELKGKNVFLNFWATWCPPCTGELPHMETLHKEYQDKDLVILTVNLGEEKAVVKDFINANKYTFKVLLDSDQAVGNKYNITSIPTSYFINKEGNIVEKRIGGMSEEDMRAYIGLLSK